MGNKFKPHKAIQKRVKVTGTGKVVRGRAGLGHLCSHKSSSRKRKLRRSATCPRPEQRRVRAMIGY